jgi:uncharacterized damage-inducible protein DinB
MEFKRGAPGDSIQFFFESGHAFVRADRILSDLEPRLAVMIPDGAAHSIADHVGHMAWWQRQVLQDVQTRTNHRVSIGGQSFQTVTLGDWPGVLEDFLSGLEALKSLTSDPVILERQYLDRDQDVGFVLMDFALHNAYHLGQIVLLRRLLGAWPPAGYDPENW